MSERAANQHDAKNGGTATGAAVSLDHDADLQLQLRGANARIEIHTVADFIANQAALTHEERERAAHRLRIGNPRERAVDESELGVRRDERGRQRFDPDDPTVRDRSVIPELCDVGPAEMARIIEAGERDEADRDGEAFYASLMQREVKVETHGGGDRSRKKPRAPGASSIDGAAIHSVLGVPG